MGEMDRDRAVYVAELSGKVVVHMEIPEEGMLESIVDPERIDVGSEHYLGPNFGRGSEEDRGNDTNGNKWDRVPVKSWKNLFSVPKQTNGMLQFSRPQKTDGKFVVKPPVEAVMEGIDMWKRCVVGQFLDKRLPFPVVRSLINKMWGKKEMPDISTTENGLYIFRFRDMDARD